MSNTLTKEVNQLWRPGTSGTPADPGQPYRAAYTSYTTAHTCGYEWPYGTRRVQDDKGAWVDVPIIPEGVQSVQQVYACSTKSVPTYHHEQPYVPPTPGVAGTASQITTDYNLGWTGGARSVRFLEGDGYISWKASPNATGVVVGFNDADLTTEYVECEHAIYCARGIYRVYESGVMRAATGAYVTDDVFTIRRRQGVVTYWKNATLIYTSAVPSSGTVFMDASLYTGGDEVLEPAIVGESGGEVTVEPLAAFGSNKTYAAGDIVLQPLEVIHSQASRGEVVLEPLQVLGADRAYGEGAVVLEPLDAYGTAGMAAPSWGIGDVQLVPLTVAGLILTGEIGTGDIDLQPLGVLGADRPYGEGRITLPTLSVYAHAYEIPDEATLNSSAVVAGLLADSFEIVIALSSQGVITSTLTTVEWIDALLLSAATGATALTTDEVVELLLYSAATGTTPRPGDEADKQVWVVNIETGASTRYANYDFNSYAKIGPRYFGCKADGIYQLDGDTDAGDPIRAMMSFGKQDFGTSALKRITNAYVGVSGQGRLFLKVLAEGREYTYAQRGYDEHLQMQRFDTGKGMRVNWLEFELYNADGEDFELASVEFAVVPLSRRI